MIRTIVPRAATGGYPKRVPVGFAGERVVFTFLALWGFPYIEHLVDLLLLEKGDGGVEAEESDYASHEILYLHSTLPGAIGVMLDSVRGYEGSHRAVRVGLSRIVPV